MDTGVIRCLLDQNGSPLFDYFALIDERTRGHLRRKEILITFADDLAWLDPKQLLERATRPYEAARAVLEEEKVLGGVQNGQQQFAVGVVDHMLRDGKRERLVIAMQ